jgi:aspartate kinase
VRPTTRPRRSSGTWSVTHEPRPRSNITLLWPSVTKPMTNCTSPVLVAVTAVPMATPNRPSTIARRRVIRSTMRAVSGDSNPASSAMATATPICSRVTSVPRAMVARNGGANLKHELAARRARVSRPTWRRTSVGIPSPSTRSIGFLGTGDDATGPRREALYRYRVVPVALIVQKYGGTSVADPDRMRAVAENVAFTRRRGDQVVVVVSAMGKSTDNLIALANSVSKTQPGREMDMLLTTGERVSMALVSMALADIGVPAVSFTGSQVGIVTDTAHGKAKILEVKGDRVREALVEGKVCVVAGFQGISTDKEITTLGRGGSDTTAVALAAALEADSCEIYTDVTGVFTADPRVVPQARKLGHINFDEMLEMAGAGSKVLALRSVEFARNHNVPLHVRSSFTWEQGTWVTGQEPSMEDPIISGVVTDLSESKVTVVGVPDRPGISATLFEPLAAANVNVDMIVQNTGHDGTTDVSFTMPKADMATAESIVSRIAAEIGARGVEHDSDIAKISLVGAGMKSSPGIAAKMFRTLANEGVNIMMISTSTIRISVVTAASDLERAARGLHTAFGLDSGQAYAAPLPERK